MELKRFFDECKAIDNNKEHSKEDEGREIEWSRTLGCKMFEEKMSSNSGGNGEEMDLLWEIIHEADTKKKKKKNIGCSNYKKKFEKEEEEDMDMDDGKEYCLQALKLSTGKTNLGTKKTSLVKISNAIKGIGWLHHLTSHNK